MCFGKPHLLIHVKIHMIHIMPRTLNSTPGPSWRLPNFLSAYFHWAHLHWSLGFSLTAALTLTTKRIFNTAKFTISGNWYYSNLEKREFFSSVHMISFWYKAIPFFFLSLSLSHRPDFHVFKTKFKKLRRRQWWQWDIISNICHFNLKPKQFLAFQSFSFYFILQLQRTLALQWERLSVCVIGMHLSRVTLFIPAACHLALLEACHWSLASSDIFFAHRICPCR